MELDSTLPTSLEILSTLGSVAPMDDRRGVCAVWPTFTVTKPVPLEGNTPRLELAPQFTHRLL